MEGQPHAPTYAAFLSYSRAVDGQLAPRLQQALQRFAKPWYRQRALRVFRDDSNLSANPGLWSSIQAALDGSDFFILLASPESAASPWVAQEVEYWLSRRTPGTLLIAVTDGEIVWDRERNDFDRAVTTCVPPALYGRLPEEPRWIDLRGARGSASLPPAMVADLAAPLHRRDKDELIGEDLRLHRKAIRLARAGVTVLAITTVAAVVAAIVAVVQAQTATEQRNLAQERERLAVAGQLIADARSLAGSDPALALRLGLAAQSIDPGPDARAALVDTLLTTRYLGEVGRLDEAVHVAHATSAPRLVTASDRMLRSFDTTDPGAAVEVGTADDDVFSLALAPDGRTLAIGGRGGKLAVYDLGADGRPELRWRSEAGLAGEARALAFAPDGRTLLADHDGEPTLWDVADPAQPVRLGSLGGGPDAVGAAFSPAGDVFAIVRADGTASVWNTGTRQPLAQASVGSGPASVAFAGDTLLTASADGVGVWDVGDRTRILPLTRLAGDRPTDLAVDPTGGRVVVGDVAGEVTLWDVSEPAAPRRLGAPWAVTRGAVGGLAIGDGPVLYAAGGANLFGSAVVAWDLADRPGRRTFGPDAGAAVTALAGSPPGGRWASLGPDSVTLWTGDEPRPVATVRVPDSDPLSVALGDELGLLAVGTDDGHVQLWGVDDPALPVALGVVSAGFGPVHSLAFAPPGAFGEAGPTLVATVAGNSSAVVVLGLDEPARPATVARELNVSGASAIALSPDGSSLVVGGDRLEVWAAHADLGGPEGRSVGAPAPVTAVAFAPDSTTVAAGLASGAVLLVRATAGEAPQPLGLPLPAAGGTVRSVTFAPDGRTLAVADGSGSVALWDVTEPDRPHLLGPVLTGGGPARFQPDGTVMVGRADGRLEAWDLGFAEAARADPAGRACAIVREGLSRDDWQRAITLPFRETC